MWALKKGDKVRNTFDKATKDNLVKEGWTVVLDTLKRDSGKPEKHAEKTGDVKSNG